MGIEQTSSFGFLGSLKLLGKITGITLLIGLLLLNIGISLIYWIDTGDHKPFLKETIGTFLNSDIKLKIYITELRKPELPTEYRQFIFWGMFSTITIQLAMLWLIYLIIKYLTGQYQDNLMLKILISAFVILIMIGSSFTYMLSTKTPITLENLPFSSYYELYKYRKEIWTVGKTSILQQLAIPINIPTPETANETIPTQQTYML